MMKTNTFPFRRRALVLALMLATGTVPAAIIDVSGDCTLVAAINNANTDTDTDGAGFGCSLGSGDDHLSLTPNGLYTLTEVVQGNEDGLPWITSTITINGHGATIAHSVVSYDPFRVLYVTATGNLTLNRLTLTGGYMGYGLSNGSILNNGNMILNQSSISKNSVWTGVSGLTNNGNMTLNHSTVSGNSSRQAVSIANSGNMTLNHSTVSGNSTRFGIGGVSNTGTMTLNDSSVSHNTSIYSGYRCGGHACGGDGGISNSGKMTLNHSTVSNNTGYYVSAISNGGSITLTNSTVSNNGSFHRSAIANSGSMTVIASDISGNGGTYNYRGGGRIVNSGTMTIRNSTVSKNTAPSSYGGGIRNEINGMLLLTNSIVSGNQAVGGAGIFNLGTMNLTNSLVSGNKDYQLKTDYFAPYDVAVGGGGIYNKGSLTLVNTTLSDNSSTELGGAIANKGNLVLSHSTLSGNRAAVGAGGGVKNYLGAEMTLTNSLIANSPVGSDCKNEGLLTLQGVNLIEDGRCGAALSGDPKLAPLFDNGGPTATHALLVGSPALNVADKNYCVAVDQRNVLRPLLAGAQCDLGAFERRDGIPSSVAASLQFFDQQVVAGTITGLGTKAAGNRLEAVRNQLFVAGHYKNRNKTSTACTQLARTVKRIDPDNTPDDNDLVTGSAAGQLADQVIALRAEWLCK